MQYLIKYRFSFLFVILCSVTSCNDSDNHNAINDDLKNNLYEQIAINPDLSRFNELLIETGMDGLLKSSKIFTVWAPSNSALENLDESILSDSEKLKQFVSNHITYNAFYTHSAKPSVRVKMISGKIYTWYPDNLQGVTLELADQYTNNGVLHIVNALIKPVLNSWEYINSLATKQATYIKSLNYNLFVDSLATKLGVDATGNPIYEPGTGLIPKNRYLDVFPFLADETSWNTVVLLTDAGFDTEVNKFKPFFATSTADSTTALCSGFVSQEFFLNKLYTPDILPDTLISLFNTKIPMDKSAIVETISTSNGIIYIMNKVDFKLKHKIKNIVIEGENLSGISNTDKYFNVLIRSRELASAGRDMRVTGTHNITGFYVRYATRIYSVSKYKVYWVAQNDFNYVTTAPTVANGFTVYTSVLTTFNQRLAMGTPVNATFAAISVGLNSPARVYLGEYTVPGLKSYRLLNMFLTAASNTSPLILDKIELEPVY